VLPGLLETFPWALLLQHIFTHCHVYDSEQNYVPFDHEREEAFFNVQRKVLPENM
jgi:hypothetical protein